MSLEAMTTPFPLYVQGENYKEKIFQHEWCVLRLPRVSKSSNLGNLRQFFFKQENRYYKKMMKRLNKKFFHIRDKKEGQRAHCNLHSREVGRREDLVEKPG